MQKLSNRNNLNKIQIIKFLINKIFDNKTEQPSENHSYLTLKETVTLTANYTTLIFFALWFTLPPFICNSNIVEYSRRLDPQNDTGINHSCEFQISWGSLSACSRVLTVSGMRCCQIRY